MKKSLVMALALTLTAVSVSFASEPESVTAPPGSAKAKQQLSAPKQKSKKEALTGSYLKYKIRRSGFITNGPNNVSVIDSEMIQNSGAATLSQLLIRTGFRR